MTPAPTELPVWSEQLKICSYDVDLTRQATSVTVCRYFLEAAWNHAEALGVGYRELQQQGKFWVLSRLLIEVQQYPAWGTAVTLRTWPRPVKSVFAMRDFELWDAAGTRMAAGSSAWLVLDRTTKRTQRLQKLLPAIAAGGCDAALARDPEKLGRRDSWEEVGSVSVRYSDIDVNEHVNSSRYIGWILDTRPLEFHRRSRVRVLEVNYLGETREGDVLGVRVSRGEPTVWHYSLVKASGDEVCRARLDWIVADCSA